MKLILYTSERCGLCDRAKAALSELGLAYEEVLVPDDHPYRLRTPVLASADRVIAEGEISSREIRRALEAGP